MLAPTLVAGCIYRPLGAERAAQGLSAEEPVELPPIAPAVPHAPPPLSPP